MSVRPQLELGESELDRTGKHSRKSRRKLKHPLQISNLTHYAITGTRKELRVTNKWLTSAWIDHILCLFTFAGGCFSKFPSTIMGEVNDANSALIGCFQPTSFRYEIQVFMQSWLSAKRRLTCFAYRSDTWSTIYQRFKENCDQYILILH